MGEIIRPMLPPSPPIRRSDNGECFPRNTTFGYYNRWRKEGTWQRIHDALQERYLSSRRSSLNSYAMANRLCRTSLFAFLEIILRRKVFENDQKNFPKEAVS